MNAPLNALLRHPGIWRGDRCAETVEASVSTGFALLDAVLPGGGWPRGALTEIISERAGIGELRLLVPTLACLSQAGCRLAWIAPPYLPYAPALAAHGVQLSSLVLIRPNTASEALWALEQALRSGSCEAVLAWPDSVDDRALRRLQLAAERGTAMALLFRPGHSARQASPAALRLRLESSAGSLSVHILKRRGGGLVAPITLDIDHAVACPASSRAAH